MMLVLSETPRPLVEHCAASVLARRELQSASGLTRRHVVDKGEPFIVVVDD